MTFTPAEAVERTGCSLDTVRYYEKIGLLTLERDPGGRRVFTQGDLDWIGLLRCLRETGMPIADMLDYASPTGVDHAGAGHHRDEATLAAHRLDLLLQHDARVVADIARLERQRLQLRDKITWYAALVRDRGPVGGE